ncbi:MAG: IPT/TIG domain-containing protein [Planctomycetota bacterium]|nr:IPT/TIG domain-containing protein [Planctomycetota bacterium]
MKWLRFGLVTVLMATLACSGSGGSHRGGTVVADILDVQPSDGPVAGGTSVLITTQGFTDFQSMVPTVTFDGNVATFVQAPAADQIEVITPVAAGSGFVGVVVTQGAVSATRPMGFEYTAVSCSITSICPSGGGLAGGEIATILGANFVAGMRVFFSMESPQVTFVSPNEIWAEVTPSISVGLIDVSITDPSSVCVFLNGWEYKVFLQSPDSFEPNDTLATCFSVGSITTGWSATGLTIHDAIDEDYFCYNTLLVPALPTVTMTPDPNSGNLDIELFDAATGTFLAGSYQPSGPESIATPPGATDYAVRVFGDCGAVGTYSLNIQ